MGIWCFFVGSHHNKNSGVYASSGAVVDLMGEGTSVHDNERFGLSAQFRGTTINVYQPCVLNDMSHGNKVQNIRDRSQKKDKQEKKITTQYNIKKVLESRTSKGLR